MNMECWRKCILMLMLLGAMTMHVSASDNKLNILYHDDFLLHDTGPMHPENPDRLGDVVNRLRTSPRLKKHLRWPDFVEATREHLLLVHTPAYLDLVARESQAVANGGSAYLSTGDTVISRYTERVARLAVGASLAGVDAVMQQPSSPKQSNMAFALVRPPGHHASADKGMGFCVYNSVAIATRYLQKHYALKRVLIVDIDVHHGNGTQDTFNADDLVFYFSAHQHPLYPGTGRATETGTGAGKGYTMNIEVPRGSDGRALLKAIASQLEPAMQTFKPEFVMVSAGFDAHAGDVIGGLAYTDNDYGEIAQALKRIADKYAQGRIVYVLEGGYVSKNIRNAVEAILYRHLNN